ncbi:hypothetical protein ABGB12_04830 [Actinocorallia sp. B10E7]|uniref:hypothetical protein n=1 Tax=Actinocorallia sp. B10E7 TaxID=3153558 RepID=UPI00325EF243
MSPSREQVLALTLVGGTEVTVIVPSEETALTQEILVDWMRDGTVQSFSQVGSPHLNGKGSPQSSPSPGVINFAHVASARLTHRPSI